MPAAPTAPELPPVDSLQGLDSDYRDFLRPEVDPATRSAALKKLFGDPHFNKMDGLDIYIDDYTQAETIPETMLRAMNQARTLGLFDDENKEEKEQEQQAKAEQENEAAASDTEPLAPAAGPAPAVIEASTPVPAVEPQPETPPKPETA